MVKRQLHLQELFELPPDHWKNRELCKWDRMKMRELGEVFSSDNEKYSRDKDFMRVLETRAEECLEILTNILNSARSIRSRL